MWRKKEYLYLQYFSNIRTLSKKYLVPEMVIKLQNDEEDKLQYKCKPETFKSAVTLDRLDKYSENSTTLIK